MGLDKWSHCGGEFITLPFLISTKTLYFFLSVWYNCTAFENHAPVAQLDRAFVYGTKGLGFESPRVHHGNRLCLFLFCLLGDSHPRVLKPGRGHARLSLKTCTQACFLTRRPPRVHHGNRLCLFFVMFLPLL